MKACKVTFSTQLLLNQIGLEQSDELIAYHAETNGKGNVTLYLTGSHPILPDLIEGEGVPEACIECRLIQSRLVLEGDANEDQP